MVSKYLIIYFIFISSLCANNEYFAITEAYNTSTHIKSTTIVITENMDICQSNLKGMKKAVIKDIKIINSKCYHKLPKKYKPILKYKPLKNTIYVSYTNVIWKTYSILSNISKEWLSKEGCSSLINFYEQNFINVKCIYYKKN